MYRRRISQSIVSPQHSLKNILESSHCHFLYKYTFMFRKHNTVLDGFKEVNKKIQDLIKNGEFYKKFIMRIADSPKANETTRNVLRIWVHHCECVFAQRLRRCQQMFCLYSKWWEERALKEFITKMRLTVTRRGKEIALGAVGISAYNWEENRIPDDDIQKHKNELEYIYVLKENTICLACDATNNSISNSAVCKCGTPGKLSTKTYEDWMPFIEKNDLIVWRRLHPSGHFEYKMYGSYDDVTANDFLNVQIDTNYRRQWDTTAVMLEVAETDPAPNSHSDILYWEMLWPRLFVNRDYVFNRRFFVDKENKLLYIVSKSTEHSKYPKYPEKYRIEDYYSCMVIKPWTDMDKPGIEFSLTYFDNPGVNIPSSVTTWVSMRAMPDFLDRLREATKNYKEYCLREGVSESCQIIIEEERLKKELLERDKLEYCAFKPKENIKLWALHPYQNVKNRKVRSSDRNGLNSSLNNDTINNNESDVNSTQSPTTIDSNEGFWKHLHHFYYFQ